jgi:hypothetical protein
MTCSERERSDAILGRPMVMKPLHKLPRKLTPVKAAMMTIMRPSFKTPASKSIGICIELPETDFVSPRARTGSDTEIEFRGGEGKDSFLLAGTNSMAYNSSDMMKSVNVHAI